MRALPKPWSASPICSEILWMGLLQNRAFCQGTAKSAARHVSNTTCAVEWYHGLASPYGRGGRAQLGRRGSTLRIQWTFARPSQSRLRRASSPRGRAKVALATSPHYVILAAQKAPFRVLFVEIIPLFPVPVRPGPLRRKRGGRRRCLWLFWPCPFPYRWRSAPGPGWFFPPPS